MARIGINPARGKVTVDRPQRITVTMVTYIPERTGYFEHRLEVLKLSLASLAAHTSLPHDVMIFDNGSCAEVVETLRGLQSEGLVRYLLLAGKNAGKIDALRILFSAAPGEVIAYSDDDILFYPGWLEAHLQVLESFPKAGMVSGIAVRNAAGHALRSVERLAANPPTGLSVERRRCIPDEWEADWAQSTGRDPQAHLTATQNDIDWLLSVRPPDGEPVQAIGGANHFQFVARKDVILQALPSEWTGKLMGAMIELDESVDQMGCLRLSTVERYTRHLGNAISADAAQAARELGLPVDGQALSIPQRNRTSRHPLLRIPGGRRLLMGIYKRLFDILYR
jgi:glycosyltransferase involved in cell wall biosynthesis